MSNAFDSETGEIVPVQSLAVSLAKAEIDQQISTAKHYPRSIERSTKNILTLATLDEETAEECTYALPRAGKPITGPSIRLAEIILQSWGNCRVGARVVHVDRAEKYVEAEGFYLDLETNSASTARVRRRIVDSKGRLYSDDMILVTGNAACAIAKRNAVLSGVPKPVWRRAEEAVRSVVAGTIETLAVTRDKSLKAFANFGIKPEQVFEALAVSGVDDITLSHIPTLRGMFAALKNGEATVEEMFGRQTASPQVAVVENALSDSESRNVEKTSDAGESGKPAAMETGPRPSQAAPSSPAPAVEESDFPGDRPSAASAQKAETARTQPVADDEPAILMLAREAADLGTTEFRKWINRQKPDDLDALSPHMGALTKQAKASGK